MFRCPTCVALLSDPSAKRCPMCGANLRRHPPQVLGQSARVTAKLQSIDLRPSAAGGARSDVDIDLTATDADAVPEHEEAAATPAEHSTAVEEGSSH